jgi:hypothetical protein
MATFRGLAFLSTAVCQCRISSPCEHPAIAWSSTRALFEVSTSAYYEHRNGVPSRRDFTDVELLELIRAIHKESNDTNGAPRIRKEFLHRHVASGKAQGAQSSCGKTASRPLQQAPAQDHHHRPGYRVGP